MFQFSPSAGNFTKLHHCLLISLILVLPEGLAAAGNYLSPAKPGPLQLLDVGSQRESCCGAKTGSTSLHGSVPEYETYTLTATYYSLRDNLTTTLMLNNKGSEPILAWPTFYSLDGTRLQLAPITVGATSYLDVELHEWLAQTGDKFLEGSVNIAYQGGNQQLGAQIKMVDAQRNLIWAEQFVYASKFVSSRLDTLWWLPSAGTTTRVVLSNRSGTRVTTTITVEGTAPRQLQPANIMLEPWETRVLDIMNDLVGHRQGYLKSEGGISILHTGNPGEVLARMFIAEPSRGYSAVASFIDPETTASQRWHGNGLRLTNLDGTRLEPVIAVRNRGDLPSRIQGKIIYTRPDGSTSAINLLKRTIAPNSTRVFNLGNLIADSNVPNAVAYGGIELGYDTPKGTVITSVQSVSLNGDHVFQVPMFDPHNMPASAGGFPWKADGDFTTIVYIKNETDIPRKFVSHLVYETGQYSLGIRELGAGETIGIDFRELRDNRSPGSQGDAIPLDINRGQIAWSVLGAEDKVLSGRSEQISLTGGVASTYACANCCPNVIESVSVNPVSLSTVVSSVTQFTATQTERNCYNTEFGPYQASPNEWNSFNSGVATVDFTGNSEAVGIGDTNIQGCVERTIWFNWGGGYCEPFTDSMCDEAPVQVTPNIESISPSRGLIGTTVTVSISGAGFASGATVSAGSGITVTTSSITQTEIQASFAIATNAAGGNRSVTVTVQGRTSNSVNFYVQIPTRLRRDELQSTVVIHPGPGNIVNAFNQTIATNRCGVYRNVIYTLIDQDGQPILAEVTVTEVLSNFQSTPQGIPQPSAKTEETSEEGVVGDTIATTLTYPECPPTFSWSLTQGFKAKIGQTTYDLTTVNAISASRNSSGTYAITVNNTTQ